MFRYDVTASCIDATAIAGNMALLIGYANGEVAVHSPHDNTTIWYNKDGEMCEFPAVSATWISPTRFSVAHASGDVFDYLHQAHPMPQARLQTVVKVCRFPLRHVHTKKSRLHFWVYYLDIGPFNTASCDTFRVHNMCAVSIARYGQRLLTVPRLGLVRCPVACCCVVSHVSSRDHLMHACLRLFHPQPVEY